MLTAITGLKHVKQPLVEGLELTSAKDYSFAEGDHAEGDHVPCTHIVDFPNSPPCILCTNHLPHLLDIRIALSENRKHVRGSNKDRKLQDSYANK